MEWGHLFVKKIRTVYVSLNHGDCTELKGCWVFIFLIIFFSYLVSFVWRSLPPSSPSFYFALSRNSFNMIFRQGLCLGNPPTNITFGSSLVDLGEVSRLCGSFKWRQAPTFSQSCLQLCLWVFGYVSSLCSLQMSVVWERGQRSERNRESKIFPKQSTKQWGVERKRAELETVTVGEVPVVKTSFLLYAYWCLRTLLSSEGLRLLAITDLEPFDKKYYTSGLYL